MTSPVSLSVHRERWSRRRSLHIAGHTFENLEVVVVELSTQEVCGRGEGIGVYYLDETPDSIVAQVYEVADQIEQGTGRNDLLSLLPPGGARNALDCALWDLEAKQARKTIWNLTELHVGTVTTDYTIGIEETPRKMAAHAEQAVNYAILKIKLDSQDPVERIEAIRKVRPEARLIIDANQSWTPDQLVEVAPALARFDVEMIEQPLPRGSDEYLEEYTSPVPLCADESCQHRGELEQTAKRYQMINIKLDKTGGLTEALLLAQDARNKGLELMVGCMGGTSLSMAPAYVVAQLCRYVDLDGPLFLRHDRPWPMTYEEDGLSMSATPLWGGSTYYNYR